MSVPAIEARSLSKRFLLRHNKAASLKVRFLGLLHEDQREVIEEFWALKDITLTIGRGESVGIIGRNGSGKSTFLKLVAGIHRPTGGSLRLARGARVGTMIELGVGFHPELNGTENVFLNAAIHGLSRSDIEAIYPRIVAYAGLQRFMDVPLKNYSSGMHMRLGFAIAANLDPDILLLDEIFAVGDEDFQKQCMKTMERFAAEGRTLLFVSHAPSSIRAICRRVCLLDRGRLLFDGDVDAGLAEYQRLLAQSRAEIVPAEAPAGKDRNVADGAEPTAGDWMIELLTREGLQPHHRVLEITCGVAAGRGALARYVGPERYQHWEIESPLSAPLRPFDYAVASPLLSRISLNAATRCVAIAMPAMRPGARVYGTWLENPNPVVVPDSPPFEYPFELLSGIVAALGCRVERVAGGSHPDGESLLVIMKE